MKTILVTGATGALGTAVTKRLLDDGNRVAATWVVKEEAERLREELGPTERLLLLETDVTDPGSIASTVEGVEADLGPVDGLIHLVGAWKGGEPVHEVSPEAWDRMLDLNLRSAFLCSRAVLPAMRKRFLAETIAEENRGLDVTANIVAPSTLDTAANRTAMPDADFSAWVPPDDVAASIAFLVSQEAGQLRGAWLPVYGSA